MSHHAFFLADERRAPHGSAIAVAVLAALALMFLACCVAAWLVST